MPKTNLALLPKINLFEVLFSFSLSCKTLKKAKDFFYQSTEEPKQNIPRLIINPSIKKD